MNILFDLIRHTRQHHAIEHATIHILSERFPQQRFSGHSNPRGFVIWGNVSSDTLQQAVEEALTRLQGGEQHLAIHPHCGTNLAITGLCLTVAALGLSYDRRTLSERFTTTFTLMLVALIFSRPLGSHSQRYTTLAAVQDRKLMRIVPVGWGMRNARHVLFE